VRYTIKGARARRDLAKYIDIIILNSKNLGLASSKVV